MAKKACKYCGFEAARQSDEDCPAIAHKYTLLYRPPTFVTAPKGWILVERPRISCGFDRRTDLPVSEHTFGVIAYDHALSDEEIAQYQLKAL